MLGNRIFRLIFVVIIVLICVGTALVSYFLFITSGSALLTKILLSQYVDSENVSIETIEGNLAQGLKLKDIQLKGFAGLPEESVLKIQQLNVSFRPIKFDTLNLDIENARLYLPYSDPIVLFASYKKVELDVNVYSRKVDAQEIMDLFAKDKDLDDISGAITNIDSYVKGSFTRPQLTGVFDVEKISYQELTFSDCPGSFAINLTGKGKDSQLQGAVVFKSGQVVSRDQVFRIKESRIIFSPDYEKILFDFKGSTKVRDTEIDIAFSGNFSDPSLKLTSKPPKLESILAFMLVKGTYPQEAEELVLSEVSFKKAMAKDLLDYFLSGKSIRDIMQRLGLGDIPAVSESELENKQ
ncbi:MAG: translocation/assembly module TamB [Candidatus Omnitrophica bacterium]|nr:translocation/assembly module TamB [Candidatus Omnitrophota bacterium]